MNGRYRNRTWLRGNLPWLLVGLVPKGQDCGQHEWYRQDEATDGCYHCRATRRHQRLAISGAELSNLEAAAKAGSRPALDALERLITEGAGRSHPTLS